MFDPGLSPAPFAERRNRSVQESFACKCLFSSFLSFFPTLLKSLHYRCPTKLPSMGCSTGSCWVPGMLRAALPGRALQSCWWRGYGRGFNPTDSSSVTNDSAKNSSPLSAGSRSCCVAQTQAPQSVQDRGPEGSGAGPRGARPPVLLRGEVHVVGEERATGMNRLLSQPICLFGGDPR